MGTQVLSRPFYDFALLVRNAVKLVNHVINFGVGGGDFAVGAFNLRGGEIAGMLLLVQFQHPVNEFHHLVVPGLVLLWRRSMTADLCLSSNRHPTSADGRSNGFQWSALR